MTNFYDPEESLGERASNSQRRRDFIRRMNRVLPSGRNRWFVSRRRAHSAARQTAKRLSRRIGQPVRVRHHVYRPLGLRHFHLAAPGSRMLKMRFIYMELTPELREEALGETGRSRRPRRVTAPPPRRARASIRRIRPAPRRIQPISVPRGRPKGYRRPAGVAKRLTRTQIKRISERARADFKQKRTDHARRLGVRKSEDIHHAIELQVLTRYPGVFSQNELNAFQNMRGIPSELDGRKQLHNAGIRDLWNYEYRKLDATIAANGLIPGTPEYNRYVRDFLTCSRNAIDWAVEEKFTENLRKPPQVAQQKRKKC